MKETEMYETLKVALKDASSNRWHYDEIDYCWTGKDADLDATGYQGLHLDDIDGAWVRATVHTGKTIAGDDVCLNLPEDATEAQQERARDIYLEQATEVVCGCDCHGEWDDDSWWMSDTFPIKVAIVRTESGAFDAEETVQSLYNAAQVALEHWDREMTLMDNTLEVLAGWRDGDGNRLPQGKPGESSIWSYESDPVSDFIMGALEDE